MLPLQAMDTVDTGHYTAEEVLGCLAEIGLSEEIQEQCCELLMRLRYGRLGESKEGSEKEQADKAPATRKDRKSASLSSTHSAVSEDLDVLLRDGSSNSVLKTVREAQDHMQPPAEHPPFVIQLPSSIPPAHLTSHGRLMDSSNEDEHHILVIPCMRATVGRVIGKSGDTIKALQQYTKTSIQIDQSSDPTEVRISGTVKSVRMASAMITDIIDGRFKGFAMLRQITRGDVALDGAMPGAHPDGLNASTGYDKSWKPSYIQGYGFMPPPGSTGPSYLGTNFPGSYDAPMGYLSPRTNPPERSHDMPHDRSHGRLRESQYERQRADGGMTPGSFGKPLMGSVDSNTTLPERPHQALLSRLAPEYSDTQSLQLLRLQEEQMMRPHRTTSQQESTQQHILRALRQLRLEQTQSDKRGMNPIDHTSSHSHYHSHPQRAPEHHVPRTHPNSSLQKDRPGGWSSQGV